MKWSEHKHGIFSLAALALSAVLAVVGLFLLPDRVAIQVGVGGLGNFVPKLAAVLLPLALGGLGAGMAWRGGRKETGVVLAVLSPTLQVVTLFINCIL